MAVGPDKVLDVRYAIAVIGEALPSPHCHVERTGTPFGGAVIRERCRGSEQPRRTDPLERL